jgi:cobalt-zinc-cadmium efflux system membrane fusion protein
MNSMRRLAWLMVMCALVACSKDDEKKGGEKKGGEKPVAAASPQVDEHGDEHGDEDEHGRGDADEHGAEEGDEHAEEEAAAPLLLSPAELTAAGIRLETLSEASLNEELRAPGEVVDNAYGTTLITPRVEALVLKRHAKLGDEVASGAPLVTLTSVEVAEAQGELQIAEQEWKRVEALGTEAVSGRRIAEARIALQQARAKARALGGSGSPSGDFLLSAPHAGRITEDAFFVGERVEPGRTLYRLVDESVVWIDAKLPAESARRIAMGSDAQIVVAGTRLPGKVVQLAHRTSENTRNALVRIEVVNTDDRLHSGDFVEAYLDAGGGGPAQLSVPTSALVQMAGESVVFRRNAEGALEPVEVRVGDVVGDRSIVTDGLAIGDTIVAEGAFDLKARMLKSQLGEGHAH